MAGMDIVVQLLQMLESTKAKTNIFSSILHVYSGLDSLFRH